MVKLINWCWFDDKQMLVWWLAEVGLMISRCSKLFANKTVALLFSWLWWVMWAQLWWPASLWWLWWWWPIRQIVLSMINCAVIDFHCNLTFSWWLLGWEIYLYQQVLFLGRRYGAINIYYKALRASVCQLSFVLISYTGEGGTNLFHTHEGD